MPDYEFLGKSRLPGDFSYPLKRSALDTFLDARGITLVTMVAYCPPSADARVLNADYRGPRRRGMSHSLSLWVYAVPSRIRYHIAQMFETELLGKLTDWVLQFTDQTSLVSQLDHRFEIYYDGVTEDGACRLDVLVDVPRNQRH